MPSRSTLQHLFRRDLHAGETVPTVDGWFELLNKLQCGPWFHGPRGASSPSDML